MTAQPSNPHATATSAVRWDERVNHAPPTAAAPATSAAVAGPVPAR